MLAIFSREFSRPARVSRCSPRFFEKPCCEGESCAKCSGISRLERRDRCDFYERFVAGDVSVFAASDDDDDDVCCVPVRASAIAMALAEKKKEEKEEEKEKKEEAEGGATDDDDGGTGVEEDEDSGKEEKEEKDEEEEEEEEGKSSFSVSCGARLISCVLERFPRLTSWTLLDPTAGSSCNPPRSLLHSGGLDNLSAEAASKGRECYGHSPSS